MMGGNCFEKTRNLDQGRKDVSDKHRAGMLITYPIKWIISWDLLVINLL